MGVGRLRAAFVVSGDDNGSGRRLSAFVTRIETALPVEGATVVVYERTWSGSSYGVSRVGAATTDRDGIAILAGLVTEVWNPSLSSVRACVCGGWGVGWCDLPARLFTNAVASEIGGDGACGVAVADVLSRAL